METCRSFISLLFQSTLPRFQHGRLRGIILEAVKFTMDVIAPEGIVEREPKMAIDRGGVGGLEREGCKRYSLFKLSKGCGGGYARIVKGILKVLGRFRT